MFTSVLYFLWSHRHLCRCFQNVNSDRSPNILLCILISTAGSDVLLSRFSKELIAVKTTTFKRRRNIANKMSNCSNLHTISGKKEQSLFLHQGIKIGHWFQLLKNIKSKRKNQLGCCPTLRIIITGECEKRENQRHVLTRFNDCWQQIDMNKMAVRLLGNLLSQISKYVNLLHNYTCVAIQVLGKLFRTFQSASKGHVTQTYFNVSLHFPTSPLMHKVVCYHGVVLIS